uniref:TubC N-terminal docking domain-containing protein n=1 Tax=Tolypothrix bouteillei VB521301 TaxID=1479485 RepID=A0A0C1R2Y5_9CYAN
MTNSIVEFVRHLTNLSIELEVDGNRLRCHAPEGALTPTLRQEIAARKTEIILFLQQAKQVKTSHQLPIQRVSRDGKLPLSFAQQRLWFLHHLSPDSRAFGGRVSRHRRPHRFGRWRASASSTAMRTATPIST